MSEIKEYECRKCKKTYGTYQGLYGHVKKTDKCNKYYEKNELSISKSFTAKTEEPVEIIPEPERPGIEDSVGTSSPLNFPEPIISQIEDSLQGTNVPSEEIIEQQPTEDSIEEPQLFDCRSPIQNVSSASEETDSEENPRGGVLPSREIEDQLDKYNKLQDKYKRVMFINKTLRSNEIKLKNLLIDTQSKYNQCIQKELKSLHDKDEQIKELNLDIKKLKEDKKTMYDKYKIVLDEIEKEKRQIEDDYYAMKKKNKQLEAEVEELKEFKELYEQMQEDELAEEDAEDIEEEEDYSTRSEDYSD